MKLLILFIVAFTVLGCSSNVSSPEDFVSAADKNLKIFIEGNYHLMQSWHKKPDMESWYKEPYPDNIFPRVMPSNDWFIDLQEETIKRAKIFKKKLNELGVPKQCIKFRDSFNESIDFMIQENEDIISITQGKNFPENYWNIKESQWDVKEKIYEMYREECLR